MRVKHLRLGRIQPCAGIVFQRLYDGRTPRVSGSGAAQHEHSYGDPHVALPPSRTGCDAAVPILLVTLCRHCPTVVVPLMLFAARVALDNPVRVVVISWLSGALATLAAFAGPNW